MIHKVMDSWSAEVYLYRSLGPGIYKNYCDRKPCRISVAVDRINVPNRRGCDCVCERSRATMYQHHTHAGRRRRSAGKQRPSGTPHGSRAHRLRAVDASHAVQPPQSRLAEPGSFRAFGRTWIHAALCHAPPHGLRPVPRRDPQLPAMGEPDARTSGVWRDARCGDHHRTPRPGHRHGGGHGHGRSPPGCPVQQARSRDREPLHLR